MCISIFAAAAANCHTIQKIKQVNMLEGKAMVKETDMPVKMQMQAMSCASQALDICDVSDSVSIAAHIKKVIKFFLFFILCFFSV